ncbi:tumor necrosis factor receptor superfamily member 14-like isoform X3 [Parambassis ranga]|uniref:Tumor necrosis factor receptor superfamily member 14-like isoform X3 n=1 Tax=Parambassis ranga TaxID=210632 RepID=A0A6P7INJ0_9TELE|nr:tumor necrosis factor receptor superfamily member 14-like isoform X3 [Parambassis ranga]
MIKLTSSQVSVTWCLQFMNTFNLLYNMTSRRNPWTAASLLMVIINALSTHSLTCPPAEYQIGSECCPLCPPGSGLKVKSSCTLTSDAVCEPMEGFYCTDFKGDKCEAAQRHTSCKPGQYIQENGTAYRDTECSDCSDGTFSDGTLTSCQPHRQCEAEKLQLIKAGTPSDDAQCGETTTNVALAVGVSIPVFFLCAGLFVAFIFYKRQKPYHPAANGDNPI